MNDSELENFCRLTASDVRSELADDLADDLAAYSNNILVHKAEIWCKSSLKGACNVSNSPEGKLKAKNFLDRPNRSICETITDMTKSILITFFFATATEAIALRINYALRKNHPNN